MDGRLRQANEKSTPRLPPRSPYRVDQENECGPASGPRANRGTQAGSRPACTRRTAIAVERVESGLEISQKEAVSRIVGRLKEQVAPVVADVKKVTADLSRNREELE